MGDSSTVGVGVGAGVGLGVETGDGLPLKPGTFTIKMISSLQSVGSVFPSPPETWTSTLLTPDCFIKAYEAFPDFSAFFAGAC